MFVNRHTNRVNLHKFHIAHLRHSHIIIQRRSKQIYIKYFVANNSKINRNLL